MKVKIGYLQYINNFIDIYKYSSKKNVDTSLYWDNKTEFFGDFGICKLYTYKNEVFHNLNIDDLQVKIKVNQNEFFYFINLNEVRTKDIKEMIILEDLYFNKILHIEREIY